MPTEVQMAEIIKWMQERTGDFFRELEAHEKGFANQLTENMQNEYEQQSGQEMLDSEGRSPAPTLARLLWTRYTPDRVSVLGGYPVN